MMAIRCHEYTALLNKFQFERNAVRESAGRYEKSRHYQSMLRKPNTPTVLGAGEEWMRLTSTRWIDADPADRMGWLSRYTAAMKISTQPGCNLTYAATLPRGSLAWDNLSLAWMALGRAQDIA
ncbi:hypothetical protein [Rhodanobacter sp. MP1X3]|jgi:hypothetical protein|uniref:hypothetical protein n=1 Tax=Rhodanobacter sp. MP1X3 TaxID=2723086 RepID=UPI001617CEDA|nr:hypothetical protein [Rhodanobacter sp. MP1X3]MBB6241299.1 hypothetical protein [Rhodanobacter sp. MP1X3]